MKKDLVGIQEFISHICDKNYADASKSLRVAVSEKIKSRIRTAVAEDDADIEERQILGGTVDNEQ